MDVGSIVPIVSAIATFVLGLLAGYAKYKKAKQLIKEIGEAFVTIYDALADDKITDEEAKQILKEVEDIYYIIENKVKTE